MDRQPLILAELEDLSSLLAPLKSTTRVKYTCFNVSANLLILGASSGGLYVFRREPCVFLQLLPSKEGSVVQLAISPDERFIGVATVRGIVSLVERGQRGARVVAVSQEHSGAVVSTLAWSGSELYVGDNSGRVSVLARSVFQPPASTLMQLDSQIVQLDISSGLLIASTLTRSYVCDTERELYRQVGQKLRDGVYGACFLSSNPEATTPEFVVEGRSRGAFSDTDQASQLDYSHLQHLRAFCSRPGGRVWEANAEGVVLRTLNLRDDLPPPRKITTDRPLDNNNVISRRDQTVGFGRLFALQSRYLLTYQEDAIYLIDPWRSDIVLWNNQLRDIVDVRVASNVAYVWCGSGKMHALSLVPLDKFLIRMYFWKKYLLVAEMCIEFSAFLQSQVCFATKLHVLKDLDDKLREAKIASPALVAGLEPLLQALRENAANTQVQNAEKLKSGIYQITRPNYLNLTFRSQSASPDRAEKSQRGSTSSLPGLLQDVDELEEQQINEALPPSDNNLSETDSAKMEEAAAFIDIIRRLKEYAHPPRELVLRLLEQALGNVDIKFVRPITFDSFLSEEQIAIVSKTFRASLNNNIAIEFLERLPDLDISDCHPPVLSSKVSRSSLVIDMKLSLLLRLFSSVLDEDTIVADLRKLLPECYYLSLMEVLHNFQTAFMSFDSSLSPPRMLGVALFLLRVGQVEQVARCKLNSTEAMYLILRLEQNPEEENSSSVLKSREMWLQCSEKAEGWADVDEFSTDCLEKVEQWPRCACGFPVPGPHPPPRFPSVAAVLLRYANADPVAGVRICSRAPSLWPSLLAKRQDDSLLPLLPLVLHLGAVDELERRLSELDPLLCEVSVRHLAGLWRGDCLNCGRKLPSSSQVMVSWTQLGLLLVKAVGSNETVRLLKQYASDVLCLQPTFHQAVILSSLMEKHSRGLRTGVVDVLAGRLKQTALMSPELQAQVFPNTPRGSQTNDSHWGGRLVPRSSCPACSMPFSARVLTDAGVIVFRCLHAFHVVCLRRRDTCPYCQSP